MRNNFSKLLDDYNKNGYVELGKIINDKDLNKLLERTTDLMMGIKSYSGMFFQMDSNDGNYKNLDTKSEKFIGPSFRYRKIKDLEYDDLFLKVIHNNFLKYFSHKLIGKEVSCMRAMILNKPAKNSSVLKLHQDVSDNWLMSGKPNFTFWLSLNGSTKKKGCLKIIEKSHIYGKLGDGHFLKPKDIKKISHLKKKYIELKAGEAIIFNNYLLHGSEKNLTNKMRLAFTVCLMDSKVVHKKFNKTYSKIFGKNALNQKKIKKLKSIPLKPYKISA